MSPDEPGTSSQRLSRRSLLGAAAAGTAGLVVGGLARPVILPWPAEAGSPTGSTSAPAQAATTYPFFGSHQAGIATPAQEHLQLAAFDMIDGARTGSMATAVGLFVNQIHRNRSLTRAKQVI